MSVSSTAFLKTEECAVLNSILENSMQRDYPHSYSNLPSESDEKTKNDTNSLIDDFGDKGVYVVFALVCAFICLVYVGYQRKYGLR